jgi:predicted hydrocarbon binding protein
MRALGTAETPTTIEVLRALENTSRTIVSDAEGHGWDLIRHDPQTAVVRNTQETNCMLGEGLLLSLLDKTGARGVQVRQASCARHGGDHCDYEISWASS